MARFKYMGEVPNGFVVQHGPCLTIKIPLKDGTKMVVHAVDHTVGFVIGEDIGADVTDERSVRFMRGDARFEEIV